MATKLARLDIRTTDSAKATLESAAHFSGMTISSFILESAIEKATTILQQAQTIQLSNREHMCFLDALTNPPEPNTQLKKLLKKHKQ